MLLTLTIHNPVIHFIGIGLMLWSAWSFGRTYGRNETARNKKKEKNV